MAKTNNTVKLDKLQVALLNDENFLRRVAERFCQYLLEEEMNNHLKVLPYQRTDKEEAIVMDKEKLKARVGTLELLLPQDREGRFQTQLFERYQRSEKALLSSLMEMYKNGVSTRKVKNITEELCGMNISLSQISQLNKDLDEEIAAWKSRSLEKEYPLLSSMPVMRR